MADEIKTDPAVAGAPRTVRVVLEREDFLYFNWVLALERPVLPFFLYSFVLFNLASLLGIWPAGRIFSVAILAPAAGYALLLVTSARRMWKALPRLRAPRVYRFGERALEIEVETQETIPYASLVQVLESRRGLYLARADGSHEILPKRACDDWPSLLAMLQARVPGYKRSRFL